MDPNEPTTATIPMVGASRYAQETYGIMFESAHVYRAQRSHGYPVRLKVWDNTRRLNPRDGQAVRYSDYGKIDGGPGRYLDPNNNATDEMWSVQIAPEAVVISAHGDGTGSRASGQVYGEETLRDSDVVTLVFPSGTQERHMLRIENYGYGHAVLLPPDF